MTKSITRIAKTSLLVLAGSVLLYNCESDADDLGSQFFDETAAEGKSVSYPVIAYNISNKDTIRTDAVRLSQATLGVFKEEVFGMQKSNFVSQARLSSFDPDFGTNPVVDSVTLEIAAVYPSDSVTTSTDDAYIFPDGNVAAKKEVSTHPVNHYGRGERTMTVQVHEVTDFLGGSGDPVSSAKQVNVGALLGTGTIKSTVSSIKITKDEDNTTLFTRDARIRIPLDKNFFQTKIIDKGGSVELSDASNFIRYFRGLKLSIVDNDGFIFNFAPDATQVVVYYKRDVTSDGSTTQQATSMTLTLGSSNAQYNQILTDRTATPSLAYNGNNTPNYNTGDKKIYAQGMGGASAGIRIPAETIAQLRDSYKNNKINILSAKIRLYSDKATWTNAWGNPKALTVNRYNPVTMKEDLSSFLTDMTAFAGLGTTYQLVRAVDLDKNPSYYELSITQTIKNIIEKSEEATDLSVNIGDFEVNSSSGAYLGAKYNSRAYSPERVVLVGTDPTNENQAKLYLIYANK